MSERRLQHLSWLKVRELVPQNITTLLWPVGTVEAHGSACLGTDNLIPEMLAERIADRVDALVAPTLNYGITRSLIRYAGGSTATEGTYGPFVRDILDSYIDSGFRNVIIMNGHGGNNGALKAVAAEIHRTRQVNVAVIHWWELCADMTTKFFGHTGGHAGTDETALVQSIAPESAGEKEYSPEQAWYFRPGADIYPVPGTILLYKDGEGYPEYDPVKAKAYREKVVAEVGDFVQLVLTRWRQMGFCGGVDNT